MIEILPMEDRERERALLRKVEAAGENARILAMTERGKTLGWVAVELRGAVLHILRLSAGAYDFTAPPTMEESFVLDTLVRSAASYGENFGAASIETAFPDFYRFFAVRGFSTDEAHAFTPMSTIVKYE